MDKIKISKEQNCIQSFDELLQKTLFIFLVKGNKNKLFLKLYDYDLVDLIILKPTGIGLEYNAESNYNESQIDITDPETICTENFYS